MKKIFNYDEYTLYAISKKRTQIISKANYLPEIKNSLRYKEVAYVANLVVRSYATIVYSRYIFRRNLISRKHNGPNPFRSCCPFRPFEPFNMHCNLSAFPFTFQFSALYNKKDESFWNSSFL